MKPKRESARIKRVLAGQNGQFGVPVQQNVGNQARHHRRKTDIDVGTPKQVSELTVVLEKETMIKFGLSEISRF